MACDLWSSSYGQDVIEEDALNMESCLRVLRILITKADTEIEELERDLLLLQSELACAEHEKWPDICCGALTERINQHDVAVKTLKNDDMDMQLLLDSEPVETVPEILAQDLLRSPDFIICAPDYSDDTTLLETSDDKFIGNEEVGRRQLINSDTGQMLDLFSAKENGNIPSEVKKENEFVKEKDVGSDDFRPATDVKGRKKYPHSRLATSQQRKNRNSNLDKNLCDFAPKTARRAYKKESKVALDEDLNSLDLPLQILYPRTLCITDSEFCSLEGSNGIQNQSAIYTGLQLIDEDEDEGEEKQEAQDLKSQITAILRKSNMSFPSKLEAGEKQILEPEAFSSRETYDSCTEVISTTSTSVSTKRKRRSKPCTDVSTLNAPMNRKVITTRAVQSDKHDPEGLAIVLYDSKLSKLQKKRKVSKLPISVDMQNSTVDMDVANSDRVSMDRGSHLVFHSGKSHSLVDSIDGTSHLLPGTTLDNLTLTDLRALAKEHNVRKYYKLRKGALVEQLSHRLRSS